MSGEAVKVDILNICHDALAQAEIAETGVDNGELQRAAERNYDGVRDEVLGWAHWRCLRRAVTLPAAGDETDPGWGTVIDQPSDCVSVWEVGPKADPQPFDTGAGKDGAVILTNAAAPVRVVYASRLDESRYWPVLCELIGVALAERICERHQEFKGISQRLIARRKDVMARASLFNASQARPVTRLPSRVTSVMHGGAGR